MSEPMVVVGIGGFGREVLDVVADLNAAEPAPAFDLVGAVDDSPSPENRGRLAARAVPLLGAVEAIRELAPDTRYLIGIGAPAVRRRLAERIEAWGYRPATLVHPAATLGFGVALGAGTIVCAGARITTNISLGRHVHVNPNATIGHDTRIGDYVSLNPAASVSGDCVIEDEVLIGVAGVVLNRLRVGAGAVVGGSACVVRDVPPGSVVKGVPAR